MAMYYYASKISAIACGTRCRQSVLQKSRGQRDRDKHEEFLKLKECSDKMDISFSQEVSYPIKSKSAENGCSGTMNDSTRADSSPPAIRVNDSCLESLEVQPDAGGVFHVNDGGAIVSGPLESLVDLLMPKTQDDLDEEFVFSFLLSSRLFIRPHELLGKLLSSVPEDESHERLVCLLSVWTKMFPYDFRDENIMVHVKHIVSRCSNTGLEDVVSVMLSALLSRLTDLEQHEEDLRACQQNSSSEKTDFIERSSPSQFAQILCRVERKLAKQVGPEEFVQCCSNVLADKQSKKSESSPIHSSPPGYQDSKKTCNLETYLEWSAKLRLFVSKNILEWIKLTGTTQQLDCMMRHAEGCGDLWSRQSVSPYHKKGSNVSPAPKAKPNDWVVIPVFADIVQLALNAREECLKRLPNGDVSIKAFNRLAAIVRAFTKHMAEVKLAVSTAVEYESICQYMIKSTLNNDSDLMLASFECEEPTQTEKLIYDCSD